MYWWDDMRSLRCVLLGGRDVTTMCTVGRTGGLRCVLLGGREVTTMCTVGRT